MVYNKRLIASLTKILYNNFRIPAFAICGMPLWFGFRVGKARGDRVCFALWGLEHRESDGGGEAHLGEII